MSVSKAQRQTKAQTSPAGKLPVSQLPASQDTIQNSIRTRAFHIYQSRGSNPGSDVQDWFHAEHQLLQR
ncbi:MAG: DUF2934 domain-containing protein [Terracidiphilus sp.]|jgi:hypothetical protein